MVAMALILKTMFMLKFNNILKVKLNFHVILHILFGVSVAVYEVAKHYKVMSFNVKCWIELHKPITA